MNAINENQLKELEKELYWVQYNLEKWYNNYKREQQIKEIYNLIEDYKIEIITISLFIIIAILISIIYIKRTKED